MEMGKDGKIILQFHQLKYAKANFPIINCQFKSNNFNTIWRYVQKISCGNNLFVAFFFFEQPNLLGFCPDLHIKILVSIFSKKCKTTWIWLELDYRYFELRRPTYGK